MKEGWYDKYIKHPGIDIGAANDPLNETFRRWDLQYGDSDATYMKEVVDNTFMTVYASHVLEHLENPKVAVSNWYRITSPGGNLIIVVPHRDLYEKKKELPSSWNVDHKYFWLPENGEPPVTLGLKEVVLSAVPDANIESLRVLDEGWKPLPSDQHSCGEYGIEIIISKP